MNNQPIQLKKLGKNVKKKRLSIGMSQEEFGDKAGLHRTYISHLEQGLRNPTYTTLEKIAKALKCSVAELLGEKNA
jgi:transcriptional regulator with XRE-family HTH domain